MEATGGEQTGKGGNLSPLRPMQHDAYNKAYARIMARACSTREYKQCARVLQVLASVLDWTLVAT